MIEFWITSGEGPKDLNTQLLRLEASVKKAPHKLSAFMKGVVIEALGIALEQAQINVTGGIIGGNPRLDSHQGKLANSLEVEVTEHGDTIEGNVGIPEGSFDNYIGYRQEFGWAGPIYPVSSKSLRFMVASGLIVDAPKTSGYPASGWLRTTWFQTESRMQSFINQKWSKPDVPEWILSSDQQLSGMVSFIKSRYK